MFNLRRLRNTVVVAMIAMLMAEDVWASKNERNGLTMEFVRIPAGSFYMGSPSSEKDRDDSEGPVHEVRITRPFYMGRYEVTQTQWKAVMGTTLSQQRDKAESPWLLKGEGPKHPMYYVSWEEAAEFCKRLGRDFHLPTEAEWEYACRAGSQTRFYYGDDPNYSQLEQFAWYSGSSDSTTHPAGQKKPNAWGLYDMLGNVYEWCSDRYVISGNYENAGRVDPTGPASAKESFRVCRGGSSYMEAKNCRSADREGFPVNLRVDCVGFRVVYTGSSRGDKDVLEITLPERPSTAAAVPDKKPGSRPRAIAGVVRDEAGALPGRPTMQVVPGREWLVREYAGGRFEVSRQPSDPNVPMQGYHFVARYAERNLAAGVEIKEDANTLDVRLKPGVILTGQVVDPDGKGVAGARVALSLRTSSSSGGYLMWVEADAEGRFEFRALPAGYDYDLSSSSAGYLRGRTEVRTQDVRDNRVDGISIVLPRGEFSVSGVVVDVNDKPVAKAQVYCTGEGQPGVGAVTDANGRFKADGFFKGQVQITAGLRVRGYGTWDSWGSAKAEAGTTNVRIVLDKNAMPPPKGRTCFPADTGVWMNGRLIPISQVVRGKTVGRPGCAATASLFGQVEDVEEHVGSFQCRDIVHENGNRISVVGAHCFMLDSGQWIAAQDLKKGLKLKTLDGTVTIRSVTIRATPFVGKVCNLKIENSDRYIVGIDGVIVRDY